MPVEVKEYAKILDLNGVEHEGQGYAANLIAIKKEDSEIVYGQFVEITKIRTKITCDLGDKCTKGSIDEEFKTHAKIIEFDEQGKGGAGEFIKDVAEVTIASDYKGQKLVFCSYECSTKYFRLLSKNSNVIEFTAGKGKRTFETGSAVLDDKSEGTKIEPSNEN